MTRSKFDIEALDANLWTDDDFRFPEGLEEIVREPELIESWWSDDK